MATRIIHIVDDDDLARDYIRSLLSPRTDLLIRCFASGERFVEQANELEPGVLLLDYSMPGMSGLEVLRAVGAGKFATIMLTAYGDVGLAMEVIRSGGADFLEKPYDSNQLLEAVDGAFEKLERDRAAEARVASAKAKIALLSDRERSVLEGLIKGQPNKVIAYTLGISPRTVEIHRANLMEKMKVRSLAEALRVSFAADADLVQSD